MGNVNGATVSAIASAISAGAALVALLAVRSTNKIARANLLPLLTFEEHEGALRVKNTGNGPALNLRFIPLTTHYQDMNWFLEYSTNTTTILPGQEESIEVLTKNLKDHKAKPGKGEGGDILWFAKQVDSVDALFEDVTSHTHAVRLVFYDKNNVWTLRMQGYFTYNSRRKMITWIKIRIFRNGIITKFRLWRYKRNESGSKNA